jgi:hypothetical protein
VKLGLAQSWREKMEYRKEANRGNHVVLIVFFFGALGLAYGLAQVVGTDSSAYGGPIFLALTAGGTWGLIGLIFGAMIGAAVNGGFWSIPIILVLVLALQTKIITH